jgi:hypothetical protein
MILAEHRGKSALLSKPFGIIHNHGPDILVDATLLLANAASVPKTHALDCMAIENISSVHRMILAVFVSLDELWVLFIEIGKTPEAISNFREILPIELHLHIRFELVKPLLRRKRDLRVSIFFPVL